MDAKKLFRELKDLNSQLKKTEKIESSVFEPHWPFGLKPNTHYTVLCDDKGRDEGSWLRLFIDDQGDVHVSMQDWEDIKESGSKPSPFPSIRIRTFAGGGRKTRTRQALLWLAEAIRLDHEEQLC